MCFTFLLSAKRANFSKTSGDFSVLEAHHSAYIVRERSASEVIYPRITIRHCSVRSKGEDCTRLIIERNEGVEIPAALIDPVVVLVRLQGLPRHLLVTAKTADDL